MTGRMPASYYNCVLDVREKDETMDQVVLALGGAGEEGQAGEELRLLEPSRFRVEVSMVNPGADGLCLLQVNLERENPYYDPDDEDEENEYIPSARWSMAVSPDGDTWYGDKRCPAFVIEIDEEASPARRRGGYCLEDDGCLYKDPYDAFITMLTDRLGTAITNTAMHHCEVAVRNFNSRRGMLGKTRTTFLSPFQQDE